MDLSQWNMQKIQMSRNRIVAHYNLVGFGSLVSFSLQIFTESVYGIRV